MNLFLIAKKTGNDLIWHVIIIGYGGCCEDSSTLAPIEPQFAGGAESKPAG